MKTYRSRRSGVAAICALALTGVAACGGDDSTAPTVTSSASSTDAPTLLEQFLMTLADIGANWRLGHSVGGADFDDANQVPCDDTAVSPTIRERLRPIIGRQFEPDDGSYRHLITTITIGDPGQLAVDLGHLVDAIRSCPADSTYQGSSVSIEQMDMPDVGDQRAAFKITGTATGPVWMVRTAYVRVDRRYLSMSLTEILDSVDSSPTVTDDEFISLVEKAVDRLEA